MLRSFMMSFVFAALFVAAVETVQADTLNLSAQDRGWFRDDGPHYVTNKNTVTGRNGGGRTCLIRSLSLIPAASAPISLLQRSCVWN